MGKIHDALVKAAKEQNVESAIISKLAEQSSIEILVDQTPRWCQDLWSKTSTPSENARCRQILFTGTSVGVGCTTLAVYYSYFLTARMGQKVLLLEADTLKPDMSKYFSGHHSYELCNLFGNGTQHELAENVFKMFQSNLIFISCDGSSSKMASNWFLSDNVPKFISKCSELFDAIIVDSAPVTASPVTRMLAGRVENSILVIESEKTRARVARSAKAGLEEANAKLIGTVLTKRKYHIPNWLYKLL
jgi:Mrp family chromosome partitioning ATPase